MPQITVAPPRSSSSALKTESVKQWPMLWPQRVTPSYKGSSTSTEQRRFSRPHRTQFVSLVKRNAIPYHKAPNGRLLFDRRELDMWVRSR